MTHFGLICPSSDGHLNPMLPLGQELKKRGHRITLLGILDSQAKTLAAGLEFRAIGESDFPQGATKDLFTQLGKLNGLKALQHTIEWIANGTEMYLRDAPSAIKTAGIEALLVDQASPAGGTVAEYLNIPFISVCNALMLNREIGIPPFNTVWNYNPSWWGILRNRAGYALLTRVGTPIRKSIESYRQQWNLPLSHSPNDDYSKLAQISQQPAELEFPRQHLPKYFHFTGPYHYSSSREPISFPYEKLTGQPLIYASMGTLQNRLLWVFQTIAEACMGLDAQLVISLGGGNSPESLSELPGNPLVVGYAPQLELLQKATLTITHAGMNTTLESLTNGVPMVAIPVTNDQPGVAARIAWTGAGEVVPLKKLSVKRLHSSVKRVLKEDSYKQNALRLQKAIEQAGGVKRAADIVEQVVSTGKPVLTQKIN
jgi:zeaxanthin glucosyltransferase